MYTYTVLCTGKIMSLLTTLSITIGKNNRELGSTLRAISCVLPTNLVKPFRYPPLMAPTL